MKFVFVNHFDPTYPLYDFKTKPFQINVEHISLIENYDVNLHAPIKRNAIDDKSYRDVPEGALDSIYVTVYNKRFWLDPESSKKVLEAIK